MTLTELLQKRAGLIEEARQVLDKAETENRGLNDTENDQFKKLMTETDNLTVIINGMKDPSSRPLSLSRAGLPALERELNESTRPSIKPDPENQPYGSSQRSELRPPRPAGRDYRSLFAPDGRELDRNGFRSVEEFLTIVHSGLADPRLMKRAMSVGLDTGGGFAVPEEFSAWLLDSSLESEIVRPRCQTWPMASETRKVPGWDSANHTSSLFGGLTGTWLAENATATEVDGSLLLLTLIAKKLACFTSASNELLADGLSIGEQLGTALVSTISWYLDYAALNGDGVGQPRGVLNDPALIVVPKEASQTAATITYINLVRMFARLHPRCLKNSVWVVNQTCLPQLLTLVMLVGTGGSLVPVLREQNGQLSILTRPVILTEKTPVLGTQGDISLIDFTQYALGLRKEVTLEKNVSPGWLKDQSSFRAILRADGIGTWSGPVTPKNGDTLSWAVTLATRA